MMSFWYLYKLRKCSRVTGFQIPPGTVGPGMTIWHRGTIIINPNAKIGSNAVLKPNIVIGHKSEGRPSPKIGDNVFIGSGAEVIGPVRVGDNVTIAPSAVVVKDVENNVIVAGIPCTVIKNKIGI